MSNVLLISETTLKSVGLINDNVDGCYLQPAMVLAQEIGLLEILGTKLLNKVKDLVNSGEISTATYSDYKLLLDDYITPYLIWETTSEIQVPISFKTSNSGTVQNQDDKKNGLDINNIEYIKEYYKDKARFFSKLLTEYLLNNSSKYKEWPGSCSDGILGATEDYSGVYFYDDCYSRRHYRYDKKY